MAKSLQDQLLSAGLVSKDKAKQVKKQKKKQNRQQLKSKTEVVNETAEAVKAKAAAQAERDRKLNQKRQEELRQRELKAQIKQLVQCNRIDRRGGEESYNFNFESKIKKIYVTSKQFTALEKRLLAVIVLGEDFELVPSVIADKIAERDASVVIYNTETKNIELTEEEEDWYKDFEIPDDLDW